METDYVNQQASKAENACIACSQLKRKCSRELPSCSLCIRKEKLCQYPGKPPAPHEVLRNRQDIASLSERDKKTSAPSTGAIYLNDSWPPQLAKSTPPLFPSLYFLEPEEKTQIPRHVQGLVLPAHEILDLLGSPSEIRALCLTYFSRVQMWFPILSEKRIMERVEKGDQNGDSTLSLLLLCLKMITEAPPSQGLGARSAIYYLVKEVYMKLECFCLVSLEMLQSMILIATYELGHGVYPATYLSISHAARLAIMMGLHDKKNARQLLKEPGMWTISEEERRAWWAVIILDRLINIGISNLPFATPDSRQGDLLPCTDTRWKQGELGFNEPLFASSFLDTSQIGAFANTCQAAHVLGLVIRHRDDHDKHADRHTRFAEATKLHQTLVALEAHLLQRLSSEGSDSDGTSTTALALCSSSRIVLYNIYACNEFYAADQPRVPEERAMQQIALMGISETVQTVAQLADHVLRNPLGHELIGYGALICHCLYQAVGEGAWLAREEGGTGRVATLQTIVNLLRDLMREWQIAGVYLEYLESEGDLALLK